MTAVVDNHTDEQTEVAGLAVRYLKGGSGRPVVVLHHSTGSPGWIPFYEALAAHGQVFVPDMPGYGQSVRPEWAREPRDLAILMNETCDRLGLNDITLVGLGFGGFVAAEMATMNSGRLNHLVLVGAAGIQPDQGEIMDQMMVDFHEYVAAGFADPAAFVATFGDERGSGFRELWDFSREMTARVTWKPYMFNRRLVPLLRGVQAPALIIWGSEDAVVPPACGRQYQQALPNARLEVVQGGGHLVEMENPQAIADMIAAFALQS